MYKVNPRSKAIPYRLNEFKAKLSWHDAENVLLTFSRIYSSNDLAIPMINVWRKSIHLHFELTKKIENSGRRKIKKTEENYPPFIVFLIF